MDRGVRFKILTLRGKAHLLCDFFFVSALRYFLIRGGSSGRLEGSIFHRINVWATDLDEAEESGDPTLLPL